MCVHACVCVHVCVFVCVHMCVYVHACNTEVNELVEQILLGLYNTKHQSGLQNCAHAH